MSKTTVVGDRECEEVFVGFRRDRGQLSGPPASGTTKDLSWGDRG